MKLAKFRQAPDEVKRYAIDYSQWLQSGETITGVTFSVDNTTTPVFGTQTSSISNNGTGVVFFAAGGVDGQLYNLTVKITTSLGQTKDDAIFFTVRGAAE